jgi:CBS domain containing-hemolysin-like protein
MIAAAIPSPSRAIWVPFVAAVCLATSAPAAIMDGPGESASRATNADIVLLILYVALALVVSFLCSVAEAVLLSITPSYIEEQRQNRPRRAALLKRLKQDNVDRSLAAILTLNTIAHTMGAIGSGAKATVVFGSAWFGLFSAIMTLMILFLSEIVPKTIGAVYWTSLTAPTAVFVRMLIVVLYPFVWISETLTRLIARGRQAHVFSRDEFIAMSRVGQNTGDIDLKEARIIQNLFRLRSLRVSDIMTPRTVVSALPADMTIEEASDEVVKRPFSRMPIYTSGIDHVHGFVLRDDVLLKMAQGRGSETLESLKRDISLIPSSVSLGDLLERFLKNRQHIAIVLNEYGETSGVVTLEDVVETLVGLEIVDEMDPVVDMRTLAREQWRERARTLGIEDRLDPP